jgi:hypothetical protein
MSTPARVRRANRQLRTNDRTMIRPRSLVALCALTLAFVSGACAPEETTPVADGATRSDVTSRNDSGTARMDSGAVVDSSVDRDSGVAPRDTGVAPADASAGDPYDTARNDCVAEINRYRAMLSLAPYERWREGEPCADQMAAYDAMTNVPHNGFNMRVCSPGGMGQNECPRYGGPSALNGCLAQMWAEGPSMNGEWDVAHGHYLNMVGDYTYMGFRQHFTRVACGFSAGGWMVQNFQ